MSDIPKLYYWRGKPLDAMSREELIEALIDQYQLTELFAEGARADRQMFGRIMESARPR